MQITAVTTMRDEGPFVLEWLAHLRALGVGHVLVYTNDCTDGTDRLLDAVAKDGWVTHIAQDVPKGKSPQWSALKEAWTHPAVTSADWITVLDVDEFPDVAVGGKNLVDLINDVPDADGIVMPWRLFGNAGVVGFADTPVGQQFTRCALPGTMFPIATTFFKSLIRRDGPFSGLGVHRPKQKNADRHGHPVWYDGAGNRLPDFFTKNVKRLSLVGTGMGRSKVELRHYSLKSVEAFMIKRARGLPNRSSKPIDLSYWVNRNFGKMDGGPLAPAHYDWSAPVLTAHAACVLAYRQKIAQLTKDADAFAVFCDLILAGQAKEIAPESANQLYHLFQDTVDNPTQVT
ncbi:MAG: glycosyltransferase family 2 protein [Pseudomonadota bacterium]